MPRPNSAHEQMSGESIDSDALLAGLKRNKNTLLLGLALGLAGGLIFFIASAPFYRSSASIYIDKGGGAAVGQPVSPADMMFDSGAIDSQVEILRSQHVLLRMADALKLRNNPEFNSSDFSLSSIISFTSSLVTSFLGLEREGEDLDAAWKRAAVKKISDALDVRRVNRSTVITITMQALSPRLAADMANGIAQAYVDDQLAARFESANISGSWMIGRIADLRSQSLAADLAVQRFRADNNLLVADGKSLDEAQLANLNLRFVEAVTTRARAVARYERLQAIVKQQDMDAAVTESLTSASIINLREKYLKTFKTYNVLNQQLGSKHIQVVKLNEELFEYQRQIFDELRRILESYKSEVDISEAAEKSVLQSLTESSGTTTANNQIIARLRGLESEAESLKKLYSAYLDRYQTVVQQQTMPVLDARIVASAIPDPRKAGPSTVLIGVISLLAGLVGGAGVAYWLEIRDKSFRTAADVLSLLGLPVLAYIPSLAAPVRKERFALANFKQTPAQKFPTSKSLEFAKAHPFSTFADTFRTIKVCIDGAKSGVAPKVIGIVSALPNEGKTTIANNLASVLSMMGHSTLLIDGDLRYMGLSKARPAEGRLDLIACLSEPQNYLPEGRAEAGKMSFLGVDPTSRFSNTADLLSSQEMARLLASAREKFSYIVVDLPPLVPAIDARAMAEQIDSFVFAIEWGKTNRELVRSILETTPDVRDKCQGVLLNKVDQEIIALYEYYNGGYVNFSYYSNSDKV